MAKYTYSIRKQDGTVEDLGSFNKELPFKTETNQRTGEVTKGLYSYLKCTTIELIPEMYFDQQDWAQELKGTVTCFGDEDARANNLNVRNPHFSAMFEANGHVWDIIGDIIVQVEA